MARSFDEQYYDRVRSYRGTFAYEKALRKRKVWIEPLFAEAKEWHGMREVRLRTPERVNCEVLVTAAGQNVKRLLDYGGRGPRELAQAAVLREPGWWTHPLACLHRGRAIVHRVVSQHPARNHAFLPT